MRRDVKSCRRPGRCCRDRRGNSPLVIKLSGPAVARASSSRRRESTTLGRVSPAALSRRPTHSPYPPPRIQWRRSPRPIAYLPAIGGQAPPLLSRSRAIRVSIREVPEFDLSSLSGVRTSSPRDIRPRAIPGSLMNMRTCPSRIANTWHAPRKNNHPAFHIAVIFELKPAAFR